MQMPGRKFEQANSSYRYGFNGKEMDNEVKGEGNAYDFGDRIEDPRVGGRWFSIDPLQKKFPSESPYSFAGNNPILFIDQGGRQKELYLTVIDKSGKSTTLKIVDKDYFQYSVAHGYYNATYYKSDVHQNVTIDLRTNKIVYSPEIIVNKKEISTIDYVFHNPMGLLNELLGEDPNNRSKQAGGMALLSEFSKDGDGAKTDVTEGSSGSINVDLILAAVAGVSDFAKLPHNVEIVDKLKSVLEKSQEVKEKSEEKPPNKKENMQVEVNTKGSIDANYIRDAPIGSGNPDTLFKQKKQKK